MKRVFVGLRPTLLLMSALAFQACGSENTTDPLVDPPRSCAEIACVDAHRVCTESTQTSDATCGACLSGFVEEQGVCVEANNNVDCDETPNADECQVDCNETPDAPQCAVDCNETPEAPQCAIDCNVTPEAPECAVDCNETPEAPECAVDCYETPEAPECAVDCNETPEAPECVVDCNETPEAPECAIDCNAFPYAEECLPVCNQGMTLCGLRCVDLRDDAANCGGCGIVCTNNDICEASSCVAPPPNYAIEEMPVHHSIVLTFERPLEMHSHDWFSLSCEVSGVWLHEEIFGQLAYKTVRSKLDGNTVTLTPNSEYHYNDICTLTVFADKIFVKDSGGEPVILEDLVFLFTTKSAHFYESFEFGWEPQSGPAGWTTFRTHSMTPDSQVSEVTHAWTHLPALGFPGNHAATSTSWFTTNGQADEWMFSPEIDLPANTPCTLRWRARSHSSQYRDSYEVRVSTGGANLSAGLEYAPIKVVHDAHNGWEKHEVSLADWQGADLRIAFRNISINKIKLDIDDVIVLCD